MAWIPIGRNNINESRVVNIVTPATQGNQTGAKLVLAGSEDLWVFGEEADQVREYLARQREAVASPAPKPSPVVATKAEAAKTVATK